MAFRSFWKQLMAKLFQSPFVLCHWHWRSEKSMSVCCVCHTSPVPVQISSWLDLVESQVCLGWNVPLWENWLRVGEIHDLPRQHIKGCVMIIDYSSFPTVCRFLCTKLKLNPATNLHTDFESKYICTWSKGFSFISHRLGCRDNYTDGTK